jgi:hypothetical protein
MTTARTGATDPARMSTEPIPSQGTESIPSQGTEPIPSRETLESALPWQVVALMEEPLACYAEWPVRGLVQDLLVSHFDWRKGAAAAAEAYRRWSDAPTGESRPPLAVPRAAPVRPQQVTIKQDTQIGGCSGISRRGVAPIRAFSHLSGRMLRRRER